MVLQQKMKFASERYEFMKQRIQVKKILRMRMGVTLVANVKYTKNKHKKDKYR